jgi:tape measure domain-containing protein
VVAKLAIAIDASGARQGAAEVNAALDSIKAKARTAVAEVSGVGEKLGASVKSIQTAAGGMSTAIGGAARELGHLQGAAQAAAAATAKTGGSFQDALAGVGPAANDAGQAVEGVGAAAGKARDQLGRFAGAGGGIGRGVARGAAQAKAALEGVGAAAERLKGRFFNLQTAMAGLGAGLLLHSVLDSVKAAQGLEVRLKGLTASSEGYADAMRFIRQTADQLSVNQNDLARSYANLLPFVNSGNISLGQAREILIGMTNAAASTGASSDQLQGAFFGLAQALGSANVQFDEVRQITDPMPGLMQQLDKAVAGTGKTFKDVVSEGKLDASEFATILNKALAGYAGAAEKARDSLASVQTRFGNVITQLTTTLGTPIAEAISPVLDRLAKKLQDPAFAQTAKEIGQTIAAAFELAGNAALWAADHLDLVVGVLKTLLVLKAGTFLAGVAGDMIALATAAARAATALAAAAAAIGMVGTAIGAVVGVGAFAIGLAQVVQHGTEADQAVRGLGEALGAFDTAQRAVAAGTRQVDEEFVQLGRTAKAAAEEAVAAAQRALTAANEASSKIQSLPWVKQGTLQSPEQQLAATQVADAQANLDRINSDLATAEKRLAAVKPPPAAAKLTPKVDAKKGAKTRTFADVLKDAQAERDYAQAVLALTGARDKSALAIASETAQLAARRELVQGDIKANAAQLAQLDAVTDARVRADEAAQALGKVRQQGRDASDQIAQAERELALVDATSAVRARELVLLQTKQELTAGGIGAAQAEAEAAALADQASKLEQINALKASGEERRGLRIDLGAAQREVELVDATSEARARELAYLKTKQTLIDADVAPDKAEAEAQAVGKLAEALERAEQARDLKEGIKDARGETKELQMQLASVRMMPKEREAYRAVMGDILAMEERMGRELLPGERAELQGALADRERQREELKRQEEQQKRLEDIAEGWGDALADGFTRAALEGEDVKDVLSDIENQLVQMMTRKLVTEPLANFLSGLIGTGISAAAGYFGGAPATPTANSTAAGTPVTIGGPGGAARPYRTGGSVPAGGAMRGGLPASLWADAPRFAGGHLAADEVPAILHAGERVLSHDVVRELRAQRTRGKPSGMDGAGSPVAVTLNFQAAPGMAADQQRYAAGYTPAQLAAHTRRAVDMARRHGA